MKNLLKILSLLLCLTFATKAQIRTDTVKVIQVHDGDSYRVRMKDNSMKWVRLAYVDCPEVISNFVTAKQPYGDSSANKVREIIKGRDMIMHYFKNDIYNRPVVSLEAIGDNDFILSRLIIAHGYGWYMPTSGIPKQYRIVKGAKLEREAKRLGWGLWSLPNPIKPKAWRKAHKPKTRKK